MLEVAGYAKFGISVVKSVRAAAQNRRTYAQSIAERVVTQTNIQNASHLKEFLLEEQIHWLLIEGTPEKEALLADILADWLVSQSKSPDHERIWESAVQAARIAVYEYLRVVEEPEYRLVVDYRQSRNHAEILEVLSQSNDDRKRQLSRLPYRAAESLALATAMDSEISSLLVDILARDDTPSSRCYDAIEVIGANEASPAARHLLAAVAEFAITHGLPEDLVATVERLADRRAPGVSRVLARAALAVDDRTAERLLGRALELDPHDPIVHLVQANRSEDWDTIISAVPVATTDPVMAILLARALVHQDRLAEAVAVLDNAAGYEPRHDGLRTMAAGLRLTLVGDEGPDGLRISREPRTNAERDTLQRSRELALEAVDMRRSYGGDSAEPLAYAIEATFRLHEPREALALVRIGDRMVAEASDSRVVSAVALPAAVLQEHSLMDSLVEKLDDPFDKQIVLGMYYASGEGTDDLAITAFTGAIAHAPDDASLIRPLFGLAHAGAALPHDVLDRVKSIMPTEAAVLEAVAAIASDDYERALVMCRQAAARRPNDPQIVSILSQALLGLGRTDEAVEVLERCSIACVNASLLFQAINILRSGQRVVDARQLSEKHMGRFPDRDNAFLRVLAMDLAVEMGDWTGLQAHAQTALARGDVDAARGRWILIQALWNQGKHDQAYRVLTDTPLAAGSEQEASVSVSLRSRFGSVPGDFVAILETVDSFPESEQIRAGMISAMMTMDSKVDLPVSALVRFRRQLAGFEKDFPSSKLLRKIDISKGLDPFIDVLKAQIIPEDVLALLRSTLAGELPLGVAAAISRRAYSEILISPPFGFVYAVPLDSATLKRERSLSSNARTRRVVVDLSTIVLVARTGFNLEALLGAYEIVVTGDSARDAAAGRASLAMRSTMTMSWDPDAQAVSITEISATEAERRAMVAATVARFITERCSVLEVKQSDEGADGIWPFMSAIRLASDHSIPLIADDVPLRTLASGLGVEAFGSVAILDSLGMLDGDAVALLRKLGVTDFPIDVPGTLDLADSEGWCAGAAALPLLRPTLWSDPEQARTLFRECLLVACDINPHLAQGWVRAASIGYTLRATGVSVDGACGLLLAAALTGGARDPRVVPHCLAGARAAARELGGDDPLPYAALFLAELLVQDDRVTAAQRFSALFSECEELDRRLAGYEFLRPR